MQCTFAVLSSVACLTLQYFSTLSHKWHNFLKQFIELEMCVLIFSTTFFQKVFRSKKKWVRYRKCICIGLHINYLLFLFDFNATWIFWQILKKYWNIKFHENLSSRSQVVPCGHVDRQTWWSDKSLFAIWQMCLKKRPFQGVISHHHMVWAYYDVITFCLGHWDDSC